LLNTSLSYHDILGRLASEMKFYHTTGTIIQRTAWLPLRAIFLVFMGLEVRGLENVKQLYTSVIFAGNHANDLDPLIIVSCLPWFSKHVPLIFVSRERKFYGKLGWRKYIYGGQFFKLMGALQAYTGLNNYEKALVHHLEALECKRSVCIFPVGKKHLDTDIHGAKGGVSYLAKKTGVPIVPVRITRTENKYSQDFWKRKRKLRVTFGKPISYEELLTSVRVLGSAEKNYEKASVILMGRIVELG